MLFLRVCHQVPHKLNFYSPSEASWPVIGWALPLPLPLNVFCIKEELPVKELKFCFMEKRVSVGCVIASLGRVETFHRYVSHVAAFSTCRQASVFLSFPIIASVLKANSSCAWTVPMTRDSPVLAQHWWSWNLLVLEAGREKIVVLPEQRPVDPALQCDICGPVCWNL